MAKTRPPSGESTRHATLVGAAAIIFLGNVASRVLGLVREQLAADRFGAGDPIAAMTVSDNLNTMLFDLLANGMLHAALIPVLAVYAGRHVVRREFRHVFGTLFVVAALLSAGVTVFCLVFAPELIDIMTGLIGQEKDRGQATAELAVDLFRIVVPSLVFLATATVLISGLYALQKPAGPAIGIAFRNGAVVAAILLASGESGVKSMAYGILGGSVLLFAVQGVALWRAGSMPALSFDPGHPAVRQVARLYLPVLLGLCVSSAIIIVDRNLAWDLEEDAIGAMRYATALVQLILGLVAAAVSLAALPRLSARFAAGDLEGFNHEFGRALSLVTLLIVPAVVGMAVLSEPIVEFLFEHGATDADASRLITIALLAYLPGHLLAGYDQVMIFAFYSRQNTILPVSVGVVSAASYLGAAWLLVGRYEMTGLVLANSVQLAVHTLIMFVLVRKQFGREPLRGLPRVAGRTCAAAIGMGAVVWAAWNGLQQVFTGSGTVEELMRVTMPIVAGIVVYSGLIWKLDKEAVTQFAPDVNALFCRSKPT